MSDPVALVLAAGMSRRFGGDKRIAQLQDGRPIVAVTLAAIIAAHLKGIVIQRENHQLPVELLPTLAGWSHATITQETAERGIGASLGAAVRLLPTDADLLVCLADMPLVQPSTYRAIADAIRPGRIVCPRYHGKRGNPVGFSNAFRDELILLDGDRGARDLLQRYADRVDFIDIDDAGIHVDIDTPDDLT